VVGYFFILPWTRPLTRRLLVWILVRRAARLIARAEWEAQQQRGPRAPGRQSGRPSGRPSRPLVVEGELVSDSDADRRAGGSRAAPTEPDTGPDDKGPGRVAGG